MMMTHVLCKTKKKALNEMHGEKLTADKTNKLVNEIMKTFDKDNNGVLSKEEFFMGCENNAYLKNIIQLTSTNNNNNVNNNSTSL